MNKLEDNNISKHVRTELLKQQMDIMIDIIEKAGLLNEFSKYCETLESCEVEGFDDLCIKFAKNYSEKFHIVPEEERYNKTYFCNTRDII